MSLEAIKSELAELPETQQDHLAAYLTHLRHQRDARIRGEITNRLDDKNPEHWITLSELRDN